MEALSNDLGILIIEHVIDGVIAGHHGIIGHVVIMDFEPLQRLRHKVFPLLPSDIWLWEQHLPVHVELFEDLELLKRRLCGCISVF